MSRFYVYYNDEFGDPIIKRFDDINYVELCILDCAVRDLDCPYVFEAITERVMDNLIDKGKIILKTVGDPDEDVN